jgi:hypothetical protein
MKEFGIAEFGRRADETTGKRTKQDRREQRENRRDRKLGRLAQSNRPTLCDCSREAEREDGPRAPQLDLELHEDPRESKRKHGQSCHVGLQCPMP